MSKKQQVIDTVLSQSTPFYSSTITSLSGSSVALVSNTLNELIAQGKITSRKEGKKLIYTLTDTSANKELNIVETPICSVAEKFDYIREVVRMVINGVNPSALITGRSGVGKTYMVQDELKNAGLKKDEDYLFVSGHSSAFGLYKLLHDHRDQFIVFDDCDSCFSDMKSVNILKAALDSYDVRRVSWVSDRTADNEDIEPFFDFEGRVIFISNLYANRIDNAICSRSFCIDLRLTNDEVTEHMRNLINVIEPNVSKEMKTEVLDYISTISNNFSAYGLRTFIQSVRIRQGVGARSDWKNMIKVLST